MKANIFLFNNLSDIKSDLTGAADWYSYAGDMASSNKALLN